jgi:hypothetical protein
MIGGRGPGTGDREPGTGNREKDPASLDPGPWTLDPTQSPNNHDAMCLGGQRPAVCDLPR